jgi:ribosome biogenesis GTPase A
VLLYELTKIDTTCGRTAPSMTIEWYPGHMGKAIEKMAELVKRMDVIIEVLDARLPVSSSNHLLAELRRNKPLIKVMNKNDLADPAVTKAWVRFFERQHGVRALPLSARVHREVMQLPKLCLRLAPSRGKPGRPLRAMVLGIPNVGKSTLINTLAGRSIAKVGDKPAITTGVQQIDLHNGIVLSDTPGVLWPVMSDQGAAYRLAVSGAIGAGALDYHTVGLYAAEYLLRRYRQPLLERYRLDVAPENAHELLEQVGRRLGCLMAGGGVDMQRASEAFLRELRAGKLGRISLEEPEAVTADTAEDVGAETKTEEVPAPP